MGEFMLKKIKSDTAAAILGLLFLFGFPFLALIPEHSSWYIIPTIIGIAFALGWIVYLGSAVAMTVYGLALAFWEMIKNIISLGTPPTIASLIVVAVVCWLYGVTATLVMVGGVFWVYLTYWFNEIEAHEAKRKEAQKNEPVATLTTKRNGWQW
jgi:hypothetical protein